MSEEVKGHSEPLRVGDFEVGRVSVGGVGEALRRQGVRGLGWKT